MAAELRRVARLVADIIARHTNGAEITDTKKMNEALRAYSRSLGPWAETLTSKILEGVQKNNLKAWTEASKELGRELRTLRATTELGATVTKLQNDQVALIKSLPIEAGARAQALAQQASTEGSRASQVAEEIARTGEVTASRATLIARTEIAKANAAMTQARAEYVGADQYIWRTAQDGDVRESHAELEGQVFRYDDPPYIDGEGNHGPGEFPNCRCFAEPIIPS
jgi:SPP1 gp7 family putative phage head morphogenesis protein